MVLCRRAVPTNQIADLVKVVLGDAITTPLHIDTWDSRDAGGERRDGGERREGGGKGGRRKG